MRNGAPLPANGDVSARLPAWKLALLLLATATLYQFVWLYRLAEYLRKHRVPSITPWHWSLVPLLGPFAFIPGQKLAAYLKEWQEEESKTAGHFADPVMVGMLMLAAFLPLLILIVNTVTLPAAILVSYLLLCLAYLVLQAQLNRILEPEPASPTPEAAGRYERHQLWAMGLGCLIAIPIYVSVLTDVLETWDLASLDKDVFVTSKVGFFRMRIGDEGWSQVSVEHMQEDSDLEFRGPDDFTWASVYDSRGLTVDDVLAYRHTSIQEDYKRVSCKQEKSLIEENWITVGRLECRGRSPLIGQYLFASRILRREQDVVEILAMTSNHDEERFEVMSERVHRFIDGLELLP